MQNSNVNNRVVITGIGIVSPLGLDAKKTWTNMLAGKSGVSAIQSFDTDDFETKIAAEVSDFDPTDYIDRKQARRMDRFVQLAAAASLEAIDASGTKITDANRERCSVMIASGIGGIITLSEQIGVMASKGADRVSPFLVPMMLPDMASGQVSMMLGAKGPNYSAVSACASGADTIGLAFEAVRRGDVDVVLAGGSEAAICPIGLAGFSSCKALSTQNYEPWKASRPFDINRDGFVLGEGGAVLVMETMDNAIRRNAVILAELVGYGASADAHHITQPAPEGEGGARAMLAALKQASLQPDEIDYINAHGTSTQMNDKFETMAIKSVFDEQAYKVPISSTKSMTGHLLGASGAIEAAVSVQAIYNSAIPPTINLESPDPDCDLDYTPHNSVSKSVDTAMSNSFGFGGHNSSLIFQKVN